MPNRPKNTTLPKIPRDHETVRSKAEETQKKLKDPAIDASGLTSRVKGHISSRGKRMQGKRDDVNK
ncbi:MAG: hypothetical protein JJU20_00005 [Opitutales bacterium]|nr:hypothetical protein [Opitutales bacterium]